MPDLCAEAAACRKALEDVVAEFTETLSVVPMPTVKRRLKDANIVMPHGFHQNNPIVEATAAPKIKTCEAIVAVKKA